MVFGRALLLLALLGASSAYSLTGATLSRVQQHRLPRSLHSLRMQEKPEEEKPVADFTPATPAAAEENKAFDPTQYSITLSIFFLFCVVKAFSYFGIVDFDD